ncbi:MAG TPA: hypothetical protein VM260_26985 [Pirellula sp.]|nr:hypothetical protein [Pirellula sp.]
MKRTYDENARKVLATITTVESATDLLNKASVMAKYAERLKAGVEIERPIAFGVLKIKAKLGELLPAKLPQETGRGKKLDKQAVEFSPPTITAYRKIAAPPIVATVEPTTNVATIPSPVSEPPVSDESA